MRAIWRCNVPLVLLGSLVATSLSAAYFSQARVSPDLAVYREKQATGIHIVANTAAGLVGVSLSQYDELDPHVAGTGIVWREFDGSDWDIRFVDLSSPSPEPVWLTSNDYDDLEPSIALDLANPGSYFVAWREFDGDDWESVVYRIGSGGSAFLFQTQDDRDNQNLNLGSHSATWLNANSQGYDVACVDLLSPVEISLTDLNGFDEFNPTVAYVGGIEEAQWRIFDSSDFELEETFGGCGASSVSRFTNNDFDDFDPRGALYRGFDGAKFQVLNQLTAPPTAISPSLFDPSDLSVSSVQSVANSPVVWSEFDGQDWEVKYWNGSGVAAISSNSVDDRNPYVAGSVFAFESGESAPTVIPEPDSTALLFGVAFLAILAAHRRTAV